MQTSTAVPLKQKSVPTWWVALTVRARWKTLLNSPNLNRLMPKIGKVANLPQPNPKSSADLWLCGCAFLHQVHHVPSQPKSIRQSFAPPCTRFKFGLTRRRSLSLTSAPLGPWTWSCNTRRSCCVHSRKFPRGISQGSPSSVHKQSEAAQRDQLALKSLDDAG